MWIFAKLGFLSIVQHKNYPHYLLVRGRIKGDLQRFFPDAKVIRTDQSDYLYRTVLPRDQVADRIAQAATEIDYGGGGGAASFKDSVTDKRRMPTYVCIWDEMWQLQDQLKGVSR